MGNMWRERWEWKITLVLSVALVKEMYFGLKVTTSLELIHGLAALKPGAPTYQTHSPLLNLIKKSSFDSWNSVAFPMGMMNILLHLTKLPTQYQFVSAVCHIYRTGTPFVFCMLTSVDKMFIRFIFAKDMQLHYIWYYKIIIKTCSCYPCRNLFILLWFSTLSPQIWPDMFVALQTLLCNTRMPSLHIYSPRVARYLINIATCCEGHINKTPSNNSPFFGLAASLFGCLSQFSHNCVTAGRYFPPKSSPAARSCCLDCRSCAQHYMWRLHHALPLFLLRVLWMHQHGRQPRNAPHINVNSRAVPVMDASSDVLTTLSAVS